MLKPRWDGGSERHRARDGPGPVRDADGQDLLLVAHLVVDALFLHLEAADETAATLADAAKTLGLLVTKTSLLSKLSAHEKVI